MSDEKYSAPVGDDGPGLLTGCLRCFTEIDPSTPDVVESKRAGTMTVSYSVLPTP